MDATFFQDQSFTSQPARPADLIACYQADCILWKS
jgi:hypothetical protein